MATLENQIWLLSRKSNPLFTGRKSVLQMLKSELLPVAQEHSDSQRVFSLSGLGGSGKSEVAIKFAEENRDR